MLGSPTLGCLLTNYDLCVFVPLSICPAPLLADFSSYSDGCIPSALIKMHAMRIQAHTRSHAIINLLIGVARECFRNSRKETARSREEKKRATHLRISLALQYFYILFLYFLIYGFMLKCWVLPSHWLMSAAGRVC